MIHSKKTKQEELEMIERGDHEEIMDYLKGHRIASREVRRELLYRHNSQEIRRMRKN